MPVGAVLPEWIGATGTHSVPYAGPCPRCGESLDEPSAVGDRTCRACSLTVQAAEETVTWVATSEQQAKAVFEENLMGSYDRSVTEPYEVRPLHWAIRLRRRLLLPGSWRWNGWVRNATAWLEMRGR